MRFEVGSVLDLPQSWSDEFDLVNQRFLLAGLKVPEWPKAISEDFRVLKSGGYFHLVEVNWRNMAVGPNSSRLLETLKKLWATNNMDFYQAEQLPSLVKKAGFDDVQTYDKEWRLGGEANRLSRENIIRGLTALKGPVIRHGLLSYEAEFDDMMVGVEKEWEPTSGKSLILRVITGKKS